MRSATKAQQAPTGRWIMSSRHALRSVPVQTASMNRNLISGGTTQTSSAITASVMTLFSTLENRFARIQAIGPLTMEGGGIASWRSWRT